MALDTTYHEKKGSPSLLFALLRLRGLTPEAIGQVEVQATVDADDLSNNRQTNIKRALTVLEVKNSINFMHSSEPAVCAY